MKLILLLIILTPLILFAQKEVTLTESSEVKICGRILYIDGIYVYNGNIRADISTLMQENSKPIIGGYKMGDTIDIKSGCRYYVTMIQKFGLNSSKGYVILSKEQDLTAYLDMGLSILKLDEKFNIGSQEWRATRISKDDADFEIKRSKKKTESVTLKKNDLIWNGFTLYKISDFLANASDKLNEQWTIELKVVKDYSYLNPNTPSIDGELINPPPMGIDSPTRLIIRKMKYYPKEEFDQKEYDATPVKYWVLKVFLYHTGRARPMIEMDLLGYKTMEEYEGFKAFDTEAEVLEFAKVNGVTDIVLEEK